MRAIEIESWALRVIGAIQSGDQFEDSRVELKAELPDPIKAARRIAAHANSAFSEPILWLIGVDQSSGLTGAKIQDLACWLPKVIAQFDGPFPPVQDIVVSSGEAHVLCLLFETDRAPFLVKNPIGGLIQREVPWRVGTTTRTATREEILRMVQPDVLLPSAEILAGSLRFMAGQEAESQLRAVLKVYLVPKDDAMLVIPFHRCSARLLNQGKIICADLKIAMERLRSSGDLSLVRRFSREPQSVTIKRESSSVEIENYQAAFFRSAMVNVSASGPITKEVWEALDEPIIEVSIRMAADETRAVVLGAKFPLTKPGVFAFGEPW